MDRNNSVDAPEYYTDPPRDTSTPRLTQRLDKVSKDLALLDAEGISVHYPDARVTRAGALILVQEQPPVIDLQLINDVCILTGFWDSEVEERTTNITAEKFRQLREQFS